MKYNLAKMNMNFRTLEEFREYVSQAMRDERLTHRTFYFAETPQGPGFWHAYACGNNAAGGRKALEEILAQIDRAIAAGEELDDARNELAHAGEAIIQTYTGIGWNLLAPRKEDVRFRDIAVPLSRAQRFGGHTRLGRTVLQHSMDVAAIVGWRAKPWALLHDAHEAYITDITTPLARALASPTLERMKEDHDRAIFAAFGLDMPPASVAAEIKEADLVILSSERNACMGMSDVDWGDLPPPLRWALGSGTDIDQFRAAARSYCPTLPPEGPSK